MPLMVPFELGVGIVENDQVFPVLAGMMGNVVGWMRLSLSGLLDEVAIHGLTC